MGIPNFRILAPPLHREDIMCDYVQGQLIIKHKKLLNIYLTWAKLYDVAQPLPFAFKVKEVLLAKIVIMFEQFNTIEHKHTNFINQSYYLYLPNTKEAKFLSP